MISLPEYIKIVHENISNLNGIEAADVVYSAAASSAMIISHNIMANYMKLTGRKAMPLPISISSKSTENGDECYTCFKFKQYDINTSVLNNSIINCGVTNSQIVEYGSTINLEIYTRSIR